MMDDGKISSWSAMVLLLATGIGTGVLVLPKAMAAVGILPLVALMLIGGLLSAFTTWVLLLAAAKVSQPGDNKLEPLIDGTDIESRTEAFPSYGELLKMASAPCAMTLLDIVLILEACGGLVTIDLFLADFITQFSAWPLSKNQTIMALTVIVFPTTCPQHVGKLATLASMPLISLSFMAFSIWVDAPRIAARRSAQIHVVNDMQKMPAVLCVCFYAFLWHFNVVSLGRQLRNPTVERCAVVAFGATFMLGIVYVALALGGYLSWGDTFQNSQSIIDKYRRDDILFMTVRVALIASLLVSIPMNVIPIRDSCVSLVRHRAPGYVPSKEGRAAWSCLILVASSSTAMVFPRVVEVITLMGGTLTCLMIVVFPVVIARLVFGPLLWSLSLAIGISTGIFLNAAALGFIGSPL